MLTRIKRSFSKGVKRERASQICEDIVGREIYKILKLESGSVVCKLGSVNFTPLE
jgi:hypothetical protein